MKISVVVPIYNISKYLDECVQSIVAQSYSDLEILLIDDGSSDDCPLICDEWAKKDKRIRVIHKKNGGLVSARITGCEAATGSYIGYVDGDDIVGKDFFLHMAEAASCEPDMIIAGYRIINGNTISPPQKNKIPGGVYREMDIQERIRPYIVGSYQNDKGTGIKPYVWCKMFKADLLKECQKKIPLQLRIGEDRLVVTKCVNVSKCIVVTEYCDYKYRKIPFSMSQKFDDCYVKRSSVLLEHIRSELIDTNCPRAKEQFTDYSLNIFFIGSSNIIRFHNKMTFSNRYHYFQKLLEIPYIKDACQQNFDGHIHHTESRWITRMWMQAGKNNVFFAFICLIIFQTNLYRINFMKKIRTVCFKK